MSDHLNDDVWAFLASLAPKHPEFCWFVETIELLKIINEPEAIDLYDKYDELVALGS